MNAKEYLLQIRKIDKLISNKLVEKAQWEAIAEGTGSRSEGERVQTTANQDKMADAVIKILCIQDEINKYLDELIRTKQGVIAILEKLPHTEYDVLHKMYIGVIECDERGEYTHYMDMIDIERAYNKSNSWVKKIHRRAIVKVQEMLERS